MARGKKKSRTAGSSRRKKQETSPYRFHNRFYVAPQKHSEKGIIAFGISLGMILIYILLVVVSAVAGGNLSAYYGSLGVLALIGSLTALVMAIISRGERQSFKLFPNLATGTSIAACLIWIITYSIGAAI